MNSLPQGISSGLVGSLESRPPPGNQRVITSYYLWKWADNDLPGRPAEVLADLSAGRMPPALQPFAPSALGAALDRLAARRRTEEWQQETIPADGGGMALCVFVTRATRGRRKADSKPLWQAVSPLGLSGGEEGGRRLIDGLPPKLNEWSGGQFSASLYDVALADLPGLVRAIDPAKENPYTTLGGRIPGHFVQCFADQESGRFCVEWAANTQLPEWIWNQWRAQDPARLAALGGAYAGEDLPTERDPELLTYEDTLRLFERFWRGEPRPADQPWRCLNDELG